MSLIEKLRLALEIAAGLFIAAWLAHWLNTHNAPVGESLPATVADEIQGAATETIKPSAPITVIAGKKIKEKLNLPDTVVKNDAALVLGAATTNADGHSHTVTAVLDEKTGKTVMYDRVDPLPWFQFLTKGRVGAYYGTNQDGAAAMLLAEQDLVAIKALRFSAIGTVTQPTHTSPGAIGTTGFVGLGGRIEW